MSIRVIKIKTGEEIIADIDGISKVDDKETLAENIVLNKPMSIHMVPSEQGIGLQLFPWAIYTKNQKIDFEKKEVLFFVEPSTDIRNQYAQMVGLTVIPDDTIIVPSGGISGGFEEGSTIKFPG